VTSPHHPGLLAFCCASALAACTLAPNAGPNSIAERCPVSPGGPLLVFQLFLGRSIPRDGEVTASEWDAFIDQMVIPTLPQGFTLYDAVGAWMSPVSGKTLHERTKVLMTALPDAPGSFVTINRIRNDYRVMFHQHVVGLTVTRACGAF